MPKTKLPQFPALAPLTLDPDATDDAIADACALALGEIRATLDLLAGGGVLPEADPEAAAFALSAIATRAAQAEAFASTLANRIIRRAAAGPDHAEAPAFSMLV